MSKPEKSQVPSGKSLKEPFRSFFEEPTLPSLRELLRSHVGELKECDFKEIWPENPALAKHVLALANVGGGCIVVGVKEELDKSLASIGLEALKDKADVHKGIKRFLPADLAPSIAVSDFTYKESEYGVLVGKKFQTLIVDASVAERRPFVSIAEGDGIDVDTIYVRREGQTCKANHHELQQLINERIDEGNSSSPTLDLQHHIDQLQVKRNINPFFREDSLLLMAGARVRTRNYPAEDFEAFLLRIVEQKKTRIERELGIEMDPDTRKLLMELRAKLSLVKSGKQ